MANQGITVSNLQHGVTFKIYSGFHYKPIPHSNQGIKRLSFLYDNDKIFTAGAIKNVNFKQTDVDGNEYIEYSSKTQGLSRVDRADLAAISITYHDDTVIVQKLMDNVVLGDIEARMQRKSVKTDKPAGFSAAY